MEQRSWAEQEAEQELAREAVVQARRDEMKQALQVRPEVLEKLMRFKPLYVATQAGPMCPACGRLLTEPGWTHGVGTKWGDACMNTQAES